jgi:pimeloyl-ACP methyl ester carboxylesterase
MNLGDDVRHLLETLALRDTVLIGHSVGGYAALDAARRAPERIAGLVLEAGRPPRHDPARPPAAQSRPRPVRRRGAPVPWRA